MQTKLRSIVYFFLPVIVTIFLAGCSEPTLVGNDLLVDGEAFNTDTAILPVIIYPEREDSIVSSSVSTLSAVSLGIVSSPYFGRNKSSFFTELVLPASGVSFGTNPVLDSMVLVLDYLAILGDTTGVHDLEVYEVNEEIVRDTLYSMHEFGYEPLAIGTKNSHTFNQTDSLVLMNGDTVKPQLRLRLDDALGQRFITQNLAASDSVFNTNDDFQEWFKGIYVTVSDAGSTENTMAFFNTSSSNISSVILYYANEDTTYNSFSFPIVFASNQHIKLETDYTGSNAEALLAENPANNTFSILAPMAGINTVIEIPGLDAYSNTLISKAELILPVLPFEDDIDTLYSRPTEATMFWQENGETTDLVQDIIVSTSSLYEFDGSLDTDEDSDISFYRMNIAVSAQEIVDGDRDDSKLIIYQSPRRSSIRRALLGGGAHPDPNYRARLNLYFTEIE